MPLFRRKSKTSEETSTTEVAEKAEAKKTVAKKETVKKTSAKKETKKETVKAEKPKTSSVSLLATQTLLAPLVTEKTAKLADEGVYAFEVPVSANRVAIREAFRELYKVTPVKVNIVRVHGKEHRFGKFVSRAEDWKKALVRVPKGTRVDIFSL